MNWSLKLVIYLRESSWPFSANSVPLLKRCSSGRSSQQRMTDYDWFCSWRPIMAFSSQRSSAGAARISRRRFLTTFRRLEWGCLPVERIKRRRGLWGTFDTLAARPPRLGSYYLEIGASRLRGPWVANWASATKNHLSKRRSASCFHVIISWVFSMRPVRNFPRQFPCKGPAALQPWVVRISPKAVSFLGDWSAS